MRGELLRNNPYDDDTLLDRVTMFVAGLGVGTGLSVQAHARAAGAELRAMTATVREETAEMVLARICRAMQHLSEGHEKAGGIYGHTVDVEDNGGQKVLTVKSTTHNIVDRTTTVTYSPAPEYYLADTLEAVRKTEYDATSGKQDSEQGFHSARLQSGGNTLGLVAITQTLVVAHVVLF